MRWGLIMAPCCCHGLPRHPGCWLELWGPGVWPLPPGSGTSQRDSLSQGRPWSLALFRLQWDLRLSLPASASSCLFHTGLATLPTGAFACLHSVHPAHLLHP